MDLLAVTSVDVESAVYIYGVRKKGKELWYFSFLNIMY
jgi:hypothetical protein